MSFRENIKKILREVYRQDVALEELFHKIYGDDFLENRDEILDNLYTTLSAKTINFAYDDLLNDYPELKDYKDEFYKAAEEEGYFIMTDDKWKNNELLEEAEYKGRKVTLNKPFRNNDKSSPKKFVVYTKNDKGNVVKVKFGAKGYKIKRDIPKYKANYRKRHGCDTARRGDKWKANYWSCQWGWGNKNLTAEDYIPGGKSDDLSLYDIMKHHNMLTKNGLENILKEFIMGLKVELEHTDDIDVAKEIAFDHLYENPEYYTILKKSGLADELNEMKHQIIGFDKVVNYVYDEIMNNWDKDSYVIYLNKNQELYELLPINYITLKYYNNLNVIMSVQYNLADAVILNINRSIKNREDVNIKQTLEHELKHIFDYTKNKNIFSDEKYNSILKLMKEYENDKNFNVLLYDLYFLDKKEKSAIIQQFYTTSKDNINSKEEFIEYFKNTKVYIKLKQILSYNFNKMRDGLNNNDKNLIEFLNKIGTVYNIKDNNKLISFIEKKLKTEATDLVKKLYKTTMNIKDNDNQINVN